MAEIAADTTKGFRYLCFSFSSIDKTNVGAFFNASTQLGSTLIVRFGAQEAQVAAINGYKLTVVCFDLYFELNFSDSILLFC